MNPEPQPDLTALDDVTLMKRVSADDRGAFDELVERYRTPLQVFLRRLGASAADASDGLQETLLKLWSRRRRYRATGSFRGFLYRIAKNHWLDVVRARGRKRETLSSEIEDSGAQMNRPVLGDVDLIEARLDLVPALESLPEKMRVVLVLSAYQGLSYPEIAEVLEVPLGTVKTRAFYALKRMRELLEESDVRKEN